ncbi:unnamed protein product [Agarophyton chilense]
MLGFGKKAFAFYSKLTANEQSAPSPRSVDPAKVLSSMSSAVEGDNKWKLTNIAGIGSEDDKVLRETAAESEAQFDGAGSSPGLEIWRIEKFTPQKQQLLAENLSLYSGDAYIVLKTTELESGQYEWHLHYWIGKDATQDESGSAAYFTVNIDDMLQQKPIQHRELQYTETKLFHSYFGSVTYLDGGIDSGFKKVQPEEYKPRLLRMTGIGQSIRVLQVPLDSSSLNNGDVFILDNGLTVYQFNSPNANHNERRRAMEIVQQDIKMQRDGEPELIILDGDEIFECDAFWDLLAGDKLSELPEPDTFDDDDSEDINFSAPKKLFKISDESGSLVLSLEKEADTLSESDVDDDDIWAVACDGKCFIYVGERTNKDEKFYVWNSCSNILLAAGLDEDAQTTFFSKESDSAVWKQLFNC